MYETVGEIALLGATQGVGKQCLLLLLSNGRKVRVLARNPSMLSYLKNQFGELLTVVKGDATRLEDVNELITSSITHVISSLGSKNIGKTTLVETGVSNAVKAMLKQDKPMRIAIVTSAGILDRKESWFFDNILKKYIIHNVYQDLANSERVLLQLTKDSKITYAIIRPPQLVDAPLSLDIEYGEGNNYPKGTSKVTRQDVASFLIRSLFDEKLDGNRSFNLNSKRELPASLDIDGILRETLSPTIFIMWKVLSVSVKIGLTGLVGYSLKKLLWK